MIGGLAGLLISFAAGFLIVRTFFPAASTIVQTLCLSFGVGVGISSCIWFVALVSGLPDMQFWFDAGLLIVLTGLFLSRKKQIPGAAQPVDHEHPWKILRIAFIVTIVLSFCWLVAFSMFQPHGDWDAWAIWNMRARFLERGGPEWRVAFVESLRWSHPDYPLLIPGTVSRLWGYASSETQLVPATISAAFLMSTVGVLYASLSSMTKQSQAMIAVVFLSGSPHVLKAGAAQQADIPLGFFTLATIVTLAWHESLGPARNGRLMVFAGLSASLAAWTKNEGLLLVPAILLGRYPFVVRSRGWKSFVAESCFFLMGAAPVLCILGYFRYDVAPPSELLMSEGVDVAFTKLTDISRYGIIAAAYAREIVLLGMPIPLLVYGFVAGKAFPIPAAVYSTVVTILCIVLGHCTVYLMTPYDLEWHIGTSLDRLLLQLWPSVVFVACLVINPPEKFLLSKHQRRV